MANRKEIKDDDGDDDGVDDGDDDDGVDDDGDGDKIFRPIIPTGSGAGPFFFRILDLRPKESKLFR